jgi:hypothetical protein
MGRGSVIQGNREGAGWERGSASMGKKVPDAGCVGRKRACVVEERESLLLVAGDREKTGKAP